MNSKTIISTCFLFLILSISKLNAQSLEVLVKKGSIIINKKTFLVNQKTFISKGQVVQVNQSSIALAKFEGKVVELSSGKTYSYEQLKSKFPQEKSFASSFFDLLFNSDMHPSGQSGITTRGGGQAFDLNSIKPFPADSSIILSDTICFNPGLDTQYLIGNISVFNEKDVLLDSVFSNACIQGLKPGSYHWVYKFFVNGKTYNGSWAFEIPNNEKRKNLKLQFESFIQSVNRYSEDLRIILIDEYKVANRIYN
jgi:hypothetical protein